MSWKVRRSSVKCLEAIISNRRDLLVELYGNVCPVLVSRFKEREENVKSDIFLAFVALLRQTKPPHSSALDPGTKEDPAVTLLKKQVSTKNKSVLMVTHNWRDHIFFTLLTDDCIKDCDFFVFYCFQSTVHFSPQLLLKILYLIPSFRYFPVYIM